MTACIRCIAAIVFVVLLGTVGCAGFGQSASERSQRWAAVRSADNHGLVEDIDMALMTDKPSRLSKWHSP